MKYIDITSRFLNGNVIFYNFLFIKIIDIFTYRRVYPYQPSLSTYKNY